MTSTATFVTQQQIGPYVLGEKPAALQATFKDYTSVVIDLTGYTGTYEIIRLDGDDPGNLGSGTTTIPTPPTAGIVQYVWHANDFLTAGHFRGVFWAGNGTNRLASEFFEWFVRDSGTTIPST